MFIKLSLKLIILIINHYEEKHSTLRVDVRLTNLLQFCICTEDYCDRKVTDGTTGESLPAVSIVVQGTSMGTISDVNGIYSISVSPDASLTYSFIGYQPQTISVAGKTVINVALIGQPSELQQIVVVGYGTQRKIDVTGSVTQVQGAEISKQASINPLSALQGKVAGLQIINSRSTGFFPSGDYPRCGNYLWKYKFVVCR